MSSGDEGTALSMLMSTVFFATVSLMACTLYITLSRMRQSRRRNRVAPRMHNHGLRVSAMNPDDLDARRAWLASDAATVNSSDPTRETPASTSARVQVTRAELFEQIRIAELQMVDEERALAHAIESSLARPADADAAQRSQEEGGVQKALEVRRPARCAHRDAMHAFIREEGTSAAALLIPCPSDECMEAARASRMRAHARLRSSLAVHRRPS